MNKKTQETNAEPMDKADEMVNETDNVTDNAADATEENPVEKHRAEIAELNDKYIRLYSEFDNFKRRTARERIDLLQSASKDVISALLPVIDDFERAEKSFDTSADLNALREGVKLVHHKLKGILSQQGLKAIESIGKELDVDFHEAITKIPAPSKDLQGKIVDEVEKGYLLNDKVIRFAKVVVGE